MVHGLLKKNDTVCLDEFICALNEVEISLNEADYQMLFAFFQQNWNQPRIDWREFAECIRGELSEARLEVIRKAYEKLDTSGTSNVCLDDIARCVNVRGNRDTTNGSRSDEQHYKTFMGLWGLDFADAKVSFDHFASFFNNVSVAFASDEEFCKMMTECWGL